MAVTLSELTGVRSLLVEQILDYLSGLARQQALLTDRIFPERLRQPPDTVGGILGATAFDEIRHEVRVSDHARMVEARKEAESGAESELLWANRAWEWSRPVAVEWVVQRSRLQRGAILGDPGSGKSWLLRYEARRRVAPSSARLWSFL